MTVPQMTGDMSPKLLRVMELAKEKPELKFRNLASLIDVASLRRAYERLDARKAVGVDGMSKEDYGLNLQQNLEGLHQRMKEMRYRHQPILRVQIPKEDGRKRPIGISATEDKVVQGALAAVLGAIYEQDFLDCSYGFRPKRSAHDALRALDRAVHGGKVNFILEADITSFFDSVVRTMLEEMLQNRVADGSFLRLVGKCLNVGVLEGEEFTRPEVGTAQGSVISPILGNIYLHYVLDVWFEHDIKPRLEGAALLIRYADDFVIGFELERDAQRVMEVLGQRMAKFGLTLHPDKTRLMSFGRPPKSQKDGKGPGTFDFLGFTFYWTRGRFGQWALRCKTRTSRLRKASNRIYLWCQRHRHDAVPDQHAALRSRIQGHFNYFGVNGNIRSLRLLIRYTEGVWLKWLSRRSEKARLNWERFTDILRDFPLPRPRVFVQLWGSTP